MDYYALRACERLGIRPGEFDRLSYAEQVRLLAYDQLRRDDERNTVG